MRVKKARPQLALTPTELSGFAALRFAPRLLLEPLVATRDGGLGKTCRHFQGDARRHGAGSRKNRIFYSLERPLGSRDE